MPRKNNIKTKKSATKQDTGTFAFAVKNFFVDYTGWGRARRAEYWWFILFSFIVGLVLDILFLGNRDLYNLFSALWWLATIVPSFCLAVRRLHDTDRSAWNYCWAFLPVVGWIILLVYMCQPGTPGKNKYGAPRF